MNRMREHVFGEIDKDKDRMVSMHEFLEATKEKEFEKNPEWKVWVQHKFFYSFALSNSGIIQLE